MMKEYVTSPFY